MDLMSIAQLLGNFGEFVGAIAVVGTLIYLAVQVRQSRESLEANTHAIDESRRLTRAEGVRQVAYHWEDINHRVAQNRENASIFVKGSRNLSDLDEVEQLIYGDLLGAFFTHQVSTVQMARDGFLDEEFARLVDDVVIAILRSHQGARTWWEATQNNWPHREHVNSLLQRDDGARAIHAVGVPFAPIRAEQ